MMMKNKIYRSIYIVLCIIFIIALYNIQLISYGFSQLNGQLKIIRNSVPIEKVLNDPATPDSLKTKLLLVNEIRQFAMDSLGLKNSKNYTTFYNQNNKPIMWVVTGCLPYELKAKSWWFPVIGNVTYKGFFVEDLAKAEEEKIINEGYETDIYSPSAWSTLGYFTDPILSNMLKRSEARLTDLIIHELTHATIFLPSSVDFNENFATFIGEKGAERYLESKYGKHSESLNRYLAFLADEEIYNRYMLTSSQQLDSLYKSFTPDMPDTEKAILKKNKITQILQGINNLPFAYPERYIHDFNKKQFPNNTEFMAFLRYRKNLETFQVVYEEEYNSDLKFFIEDIVRRSEKDEELPFKME